MPLTAKAIDAIKAMPGGFKFVFYHPESQTRRDTAHKVWESAREAAGYSWLRIHDLRHAYGIKLTERGCAMHFISEVMGNHSVDYTRKQYARFNPESASRAVLQVLEGGKNGTKLAQAS